MITYWWMKVLYMHVYDMEQPWSNRFKVIHGLIMIMFNNADLHDVMVWWFIIQCSMFSHPYDDFFCPTIACACWFCHIPLWSDNLIVGMFTSLLLLSQSMLASSQQYLYIHLLVFASTRSQSTILIYSFVSFCINTFYTCHYKRYRTTMYIQHTYEHLQFHDS